MAGVLVINGPNLNMLGVREKEFYGSRSLEDINTELKEMARQENIEIYFFQSNHEGAIVDRIHQAYEKIDCIIINAAAFTHYSIAIYDALKTVRIPVIEVHLSNIYAREEFRHKSLISAIAEGGIFGLGDMGYKLALKAACELIKERRD